MQRSFQKKTKKGCYEKASRRSWRPSVAGCQKRKKTVPSSEEKHKKKTQKGDIPSRWPQELQPYNEMLVKTFLLKHIKDPYREH